MDILIWDIQYNFLFFIWNNIYPLLILYIDGNNYVLLYMLKKSNWLMNYPLAMADISMATNVIFLIFIPSFYITWNYKLCLKKYYYYYFLNESRSNNRVFNRNLCIKEINSSLNTTAEWFEKDTTIEIQQVVYIILNSFCFNLWDTLERYIKFNPWPVKYIAKMNTYCLIYLADSNSSTAIHSGYNMEKKSVTNMGHHDMRI